jgi:DNA-binding MarR family transcriptional regulator
MGPGQSQAFETQSIIDRDSISTAMLVLTVLRQNHPSPMTTYHLGLCVEDNRNPPRPLSMIMKTLSSDGYIVRAAAAGKRAALWMITQRGLISLDSRAEKWRAAEIWLEHNPCHSEHEIHIVRSLFRLGNQSPKHLSDTCRLAISPVRTALKKLVLRCLVERPVVPTDGYRLTEAGLTFARQVNVNRNPNLRII